MPWKGQGRLVPHWVMRAARLRGVAHSILFKLERLRVPCRFWSAYVRTFPRRVIHEKVGAFMGAVVFGMRTTLMFAAMLNAGRWMLMSVNGSIFA